MNKWESTEKFYNTYHDAVNGKIPLTGNICPVCEIGELHLYTHVFQKDYKHAGGWAWCDHCKHYAHFRGPVPEWWAEIEPLDIKPLDIPPEHLSMFVEKIDARNKTIDGVIK